MKRKIIFLILIGSFNLCFSQQKKTTLPKHYISRHHLIIREAINDMSEKEAEIEITFIPPSNDENEGSISLKYNGTDHVDNFSLTYLKTIKDHEGITYWYKTFDSKYPMVRIRKLFQPIVDKNRNINYSYMVVFSGNYSNSELEYKMCYLSNELIIKDEPVSNIAGASIYLPDPRKAIASKTKTYLTKIPKTDIIRYYQKFGLKYLNENSFHLPFFENGSDSCILVQIERKGALNLITYSMQCD